MIFDKQAFIKNAEPHIKKLIPGSHIEVLDGMEVSFIDKRFGEIPYYEVEGERFYLYPVPCEWCKEGNQISQMSLFDYSGGD